MKCTETLKNIARCELEIIKLNEKEKFNSKSTKLTQKTTEITYVNSDNYEQLERQKSKLFQENKTLKQRVKFQSIVKNSNTTIEKVKEKFNSNYKDNEKYQSFKHKNSNSNVSTDYKNGQTNEPSNKTHTREHSESTSTMSQQKNELEYELNKEEESMADNIEKYNTQHDEKFENDENYINSAPNLYSNLKNSTKSKPQKINKDKIFFVEGSEANNRDLILIEENILNRDYKLKGARFNKITNLVERNSITQKSVTESSNFENMKKNMSFGNASVKEKSISKSHLQLNSQPNTKEKVTTKSYLQLNAHTSTKEKPATKSYLKLNSIPDSKEKVTTKNYLQSNSQLDTKEKISTKNYLQINVQSDIKSPPKNIAEKENLGLKPKQNLEYNISKRNLRNIIRTNLTPSNMKTPIVFNSNYTKKPDNRNTYDNLASSFRNENSITKRVVRESNTQNQSSNSVIRGESSSKSILKKIIKHSPITSFETPTKNSITRDNSNSSRFIKTTITRKPLISCAKDNIRNIVNKQKENCTYNVLSRSEVKNPIMNSNFTPTGFTTNLSFSRTRTDIKKGVPYRPEISPIKASANNYSELIKKVDNSTNEQSRVEERRPS